jgi:hypothetical protein
MVRRICTASGLAALGLALVGCGKGEDTGVVIEDDLGTYTLDAEGYTGDVAFTVPEGAASVMFYCGEWGDDVLGAVWYASGPSGSLYDGDAGSSTFRAEFLDDLVPLVLPQTPDVPLEAGTYSANIWIDTPNSLTLSCASLSRVANVGDSAEVHLELVFVGLGDLDAASAPDDADLQAALEQLTDEWASAGLTPTFSYKDFSGDTDRFSVVDMSDSDFSEFNALLRTADPDEEKSITFFLVQELNYDGATTLGLSAGPPGAATLHGTSKSGVVVTAEDIRSAPTDVGKIMAHEGGHFLGLFHTTEKDGAKSDPISDTPECPASADANSNGVLNTDECAGQGAENVMWWTLTSGTATLSDDQGWVARRNPVGR